MLDIKIIREQPERLRESILERRLDPSKVDLDRLITIDDTWRQTQTRADELRGRRNAMSATIKNLAPAERASTVQAVKELKAELSELEGSLLAMTEERERLLRLMPNLLGPGTPHGATDADNVEVKRVGEPPSLSFTPRDHVTLGQITDTLDFERGSRVTGSNFYFLKHEAAFLELALLQYAMSVLVPRGFIPLCTPDIARDSILHGIGFAPRGPETQVYSLEGTDLSLVGTAEITVGGFHAGEILEADALPLRYLGLSHCFRTEAGAYGKESRGLYRVHQFSKAEMFILCPPEASEAQHEELLALEESLWSGLGLPYRVVNVCAGDLGAPAAKKYDIEAWMPGRGAYGEVTSCSNCTDYQARRLGIRYRPAIGQNPRFVHLLNGTALAVSRAIIAIYENYQNEDGSIRIPEALRPWMGGAVVIPARR